MITNRRAENYASWHVNAPQSSLAAGMPEASDPSSANSSGGRVSLVTWNVNSVRAHLDHVLTYLETCQPDIVCLQETKVENRLFPKVPFLEMGYDIHMHGAKGYAGVATLSKLDTEDAHEGFRSGPADLHPRILNCKFSGNRKDSGKVMPLRVYNLYVPNGTAIGSDAFDYKLRWLQRLRCELDASCRPDEALIVCGDFNIAPDARDVWDVEVMRGAMHFTEDEHAALRCLVDFGLKDCFRKHNEGAGEFTWFDYRQNAWELGQGLRIDLIYATAPIWQRCVLVRHDPQPRTWDLPSDHLPVYAEFEL